MLDRLRLARALSEVSGHEEGSVLAAAEKTLRAGEKRDRIESRAGEGSRDCAQGRGVGPCRQTALLRGYLTFSIVLR